MEGHARRSFSLPPECYRCISQISRLADRQTDRQTDTYTAPFEFLLPDQLVNDDPVFQPSFRRMNVDAWNHLAVGVHHIKAKTDLADESMQNRSACSAAAVAVNRMPGIQSVKSIHDKYS